VRVYVALGSNLDDPVAQVCAGAQALGRLPGTRLMHCSSLYRTAPVGIAEQPDFINAVCEANTSMPAGAFMQALLDIEHAQGRQRDIPGGPRTLDLDLLLYGDLTCHEPGLTLPHPRLHERAFVLYPLSEIAPGLSVPGRGQVENLRAGCAGQAIERLAAVIPINEGTPAQK
jgi:2-amino-4-hydroxy-6-hydroxymethyldihydropteridine diphosphokinase